MSVSGPDAITTFWNAARRARPSLPADVPEAWAFGATAEQADDLLELVSRGTKTAMASSLWDYETAGDTLPRIGDLSVVLDGRGVPRAVIGTTDVRVIPFDEVGAEHAFAEGEGERTLCAWREEHERFWREHSPSVPPFARDMPVVCERFEMLYSPGS